VLGPSKEIEQAPSCLSIHLEVCFGLQKGRFKAQKPPFFEGFPCNIQYLVWSDPDGSINLLFLRYALLASSALKFHL